MRTRSSTTILFAENTSSEHKDDFFVTTMCRIQTNNKNGHTWNQSWTAYSSNLSMTGVAGRHPQSRQRIPHCAKCDLLPAKAFHLHACPKSFFPSQSSSSSSAT